MFSNLLPCPAHLKPLGGSRALAKHEPTLLNDPGLPAEGYRLSITADEATLAYSTDAGKFYGLQTLLQLRQTDGTVPLALIEDAPAFRWRGFMIDSSRHIQTVEEIKTFIDAASRFKLNVFHWHLCDDPGWRLEVERYPRLAEVAAYRDGWGFGNDNPERYGGCFTKAQIRDIIDFCAARHITVVPEFDIPGHSSALIHAYPHLSCTGDDVAVLKDACVSDNVLCPGKETTFDFCEGVLEEIIDLFPGQYIHIGGDEVPKDSWDACPLCQKRIADEGLADSEELQGYFTKRIAAFIKSHGKTPIGWNEVLNAGLDPDDVVVCKWHDDRSRCDDFANRGGKIIMEETKHVYLDYDYHRTPLQQTYRYNLLPDSLTAAGKQNVLGIEAPIWTEWVETFRRMCYMCFPRLLAAAELGWYGKAATDYPDFKARAEAQRSALAAIGVEMAPLSDWDPE
ncbi:MAG: beta-N-acetylhexosaminidase [Clostridia bacterium]|nr:beta-N-acetylhexosaminidase [Clostridia bacterium]